jgi:hypothetical protein
MPRPDESSIIAVDRFILATRDSGYKGTASAVAELVDNSLQAGAQHVTIEIETIAEDCESPFRVSVLDDGCGMDRRTLRQALRFGGSSRFDDRSGLGRYGMGLPNSSLSQARRVEVYCWQRPGAVLYSYLDVDEIASRQIIEVPEPRAVALPAWNGKPRSSSGTLVVWSRCDRLDHRRSSTIIRNLHRPLGRMFRYFLWDGVEIGINGGVVAPVDPLYLRERHEKRAATAFGKPIEYEIEARSSNGAVTGCGTVVVRFSELPVHAWHHLPNEEKRRLGIANGAGVSVVRANREIDFGWFFMGSKRRENYDDWWRCEVRFEPILDEAFGITHTKQQIRPQEYLVESLSSDMENIGKALNTRVRQAHLEVRAVDRTVEVERTATERDQLLKPLPRAANVPGQESLADQLAKRHPSILEKAAPGENGSVQYRIIQDEVKDTSFYSFVIKDGLLVLVLNREHPFYRRLYKPLVENETPENKDIRAQVDLLLLAAARAEAAATREAQRETLVQFRKTWSDNLATFLNG